MQQKAAAAKSKAADLLMRFWSRSSVIYTTIFVIYAERILTGVSNISKRESVM